ncbi:glutathione S-transferase family protein [Octadecabacter sp. G9-8]|uniref:Glutathione S-transferase family protein n=1 Tax=Octadecabacter dasysiphoniae TaxID=2909341 RepID=A0ABS9CZR1_9RHOB|nr:glutathione S-transferase family protein [Octadecabacter dasysiphoniae]MCF2872689.1 glutathione S-transferase family protein [Octadecabacter dasysiphoniae]
MLTLYAAKNTVAVAPHIALEETGLSYQISWVSFADNDQRKPEYLALNPKGRVPALVTADGIITEAPAILDYIAEISGDLMPTDAYARAKVRELVSYLASTMHPNHAHGLRGERWSDDPAAHASMKAKVPETMAASSAYVESCLPDNGWLVGTYSIADIHLYNVCRWLKGDGVDITDYPKLAAHFDAMHARPAVVRVEGAHG